MDPIRLTMMNDGAAPQEKSQNRPKAADMDRLAGSVAFLASGLGPQIAFAPAGLADVSGTDGGGAGDAGKDAGSGSGNGDEKNKAVPDAGKKTDVNAGKADAGKGNEKPVRPEWLPESMWDADKGFKKDDLDSLIASKAERDAAKAQVPEKPDGYQAKLPATFKMPEGFELPEGETVLDETDPRVVALREVAHGKGWSQADFEEVLAFGVNQDIAERGRIKEAVSKEREKLGGRGVERIKSVTGWLDAKLGSDLASSLHSMMFTAKQVEAFEAVMRLNRGDVPGTPGASRDSRPAEISDEDWDKMSSTDQILYARKNSKSN
nr:MAG TPA: hypothetical protein [Caudoviricetes sp.]